MDFGNDMQFERGDHSDFPLLSRSHLAQMPDAIFPAGLFQPEGCYRFGQEELLLASWSAHIIRGKIFNGEARVAELGCGCGAGLIAFSKLFPEAEIIGFEAEPVLVEAAYINIAACSLQDRISVFQQSVEKSISLTDYGGSCAAVFANPPWRRENQGNFSISRLRKSALWQTYGQLDGFCASAHWLLGHHGVFLAMIAASILTDFCESISRNGFGLRKILPVAHFADKNPERLLMLCQKNAKSDVRMENTLILYEKSALGKRACLRAAEICPWL